MDFYLKYYENGPKSGRRVCIGPQILFFKEKASKKKVKTGLFLCSLEVSHQQFYYRFWFPPADIEVAKHSESSQLFELISGGVACSNLVFFL